MQPELTVPFFSVVIPLYNKEPHIERTLLSVLAQSFANFEVVVVDDGSKDGGANLVCSMTDPRIRLISQMNGGVSVARNTGIAHARGKWIAFLDADDWFHPEHLSVLFECISADSEARIVASGYRTIDEAKLVDFSGWPLARSSSRERISNLPTRWLHSAPFFTSSIALRRDLLKSLVPCFAIGESHGEDLDLWFRAAEQAHIIYDPAATVGRTLVADSLTALQKKIVAPPFLARMKARIRDGTTPIELQKPSSDFVNQQLLTLARQACGRGDRGAAIAIFNSSDAMFDTPRWWMTILLVYLVPKGAVRAFQKWRTTRRMDIH
jgi:glycosyltransferase involved in cell wall biosynthesis